MAGRPVRDDAFATLRGASCCRGSHAGQHRRLSSRRSTRPAKYCCCSSPSAWQSGEDGLGVDSDDAELAQNLGTAALAVILVEGGLSTKWQTIRTVLAPAGVVATVGVGLSVALTAVGAHALLGMSWQQAFLLGAILSSTDAAAVFAVLRDLPVPRRLAGLLEAESGFNDAPTSSYFCSQPRRCTKSASWASRSIWCTSLRPAG